MSTKKISTQKLASLIIASFMWVLFAGNTNNPDYKNYEHIYNSLNFGGLGSYSGVEIGFSAFMKLTGFFGLSFQQFLMVEATIFIILLLKLTFYFSKIPSLSLLIYVFFPFFLDIVQIRNSLAYIIVLNGMNYLLNEKKMRYVLTVLVASLFHSTSLFYLILLLPYLIKKRTLTSIIIPITVLFYIFRFKIANITMSLLSVGDKYTVYLDGTSYFNQLVYLLFITGNIVLTYYHFIKIKKLRDRVTIDNRIVELSVFSFNASILLLLIVPILSFDADFFRLYRNLMILYIINYCNYLSVKLYIKNTTYLIMDYIGIIGFFLIGINYLYYYQAEEVFLQILRNNYFIRMIL